MEDSKPTEDSKPNTSDPEMANKLLKHPLLSTEVMAQLRDNYSTMKKLLNEEEIDESQPYQTRYDAKEYVRKALNLVRGSLENSQLQDPSVIPILATIYFQHAVLLVETEELKDGERYFLRAYETLGNKTVEPNTILITISILNQLGILYTKYEQFAKAQDYLKQAEESYKAFKSKHDSKLIVPMCHLFGSEAVDEPPGDFFLEKLYTLTLYYVAQAYGNVENYIDSAIYCHMTLQRQLDFKDYSSVEWALNAATLSQFFLEKKMFSLARHHLSAATYILGKHEDTLPKDSSNESADVEEFRHRSADVARCWGKYGIALLNASRERLNIQTEDNQENESLKIEDPNLDKVKNLKFDSIASDIEHICNSITDRYLLDFEDAKLVFLNVKKWLDDAKEYYILMDHASDYVQIIQDLSQAYKYLACFETNEDRQAKMHKRRIDLLEEVKDQLNESYYLSICRELWIELGETYSEILDIKLDRLKATDEKPTPAILTKINKLTEQAISNFKCFINSVKPEGQEKIPEDFVRTTLCTYFHIGRLYNKFISCDKKVQLYYSTKSLDAYTFIVNYCEKNPKYQEEMAAELDVCKDMTKLLPIKIERLSEEMSNLKISQ